MKIKKLPKWIIVHSLTSLDYPDNNEFAELLNSCGSMTEQLKKLHYDFSVELLKTEISDNKISRYTLLKLNNTPVIIAESSCLITDDIFFEIIKNADTTPIGKYLFAKNSQIIRSNVEITQIKSHGITNAQIIQSFILKNFSPSQLFWLRTSVFRHSQQQMNLNETILPNIYKFIN